MLTYNLSNIDELISFDEECTKAVNQCPGHNAIGYIYMDGLNSISFIYVKWFGHFLLWERGYSSHLSKKAMKTFDRYYVNRFGCVFDCVSKKTYTNADTFRIEKAYRMNKS